MNHDIADNDAPLSAKPFVRGVGTAERVILRVEDEPKYISVNGSEYSAVDNTLRDNTLSEYLSLHLTGKFGLNFREAVQLLAHLDSVGFLQNSSTGLRSRLRELRGEAEVVDVGWRKRTSQLVRWLLDLPFLRFRAELPTGSMAWLRPLSTPIFLASIVLTGLASLLLGPNPFSGLAIHSYRSMLDDPALLLLNWSLSLSTAFGATAVFQIFCLIGLGVRWIPISARLTGLFFLRIAVSDEEAFMSSRIRHFCYRMNVLLMPWVCGFVAWQMAMRGIAQPQGMITLAGAFWCVGMVAICPLFRSPLVKMFEGQLAVLDLLNLVRTYLRHGLLTGLFKPRQATVWHSTQLNLEFWTAVLASASLVWLYVVGLVCLDFAIQGAPEIWAQLLRAEDWGKRLVAATLVVIPFAAFLAVGAEVWTILFQNLSAVVRLPVRKARGKLGNRFVKPSHAVSEFLRTVPILSHLSDEGIERLTEHLMLQSCKKGEVIIQEGEVGDVFYILAAGKVDVIKENPEGFQEIVDVLHPGDSFGEIALVEDTQRTATIRARGECKVLALKRTFFDILFPHGSQERLNLTATIGYVKLLQESQALSYLTPTQIKRFVSSCESRSFSAGEYLIRQGAEGDYAYLIESGVARVQRQGVDKPIAFLGRGEIVGAIALLKDIPRTADVTAEEPIRCLVISKDEFLNVCKSNLFVALVISDLSDRQLSDLGDVG